MRWIHGWLGFLYFLYLTQYSWAINVGIGMSDITGPAAEIGMVSTIKQKSEQAIVEFPMPLSISNENNL